MEGCALLRQIEMFCLRLALQISGRSRYVPLLALGGICPTLTRTFVCIAQ